MCIRDRGGGDAVIRLRRLKFTAGAVGLADVVVAHKLPFQPGAALGADADVLNDVLAFLPVLRHAVNPEKDTAVLGFEAGAEQVVRIEDQPGPVGNVTLQHVEDKFLSLIHICSAIFFLPPW